LRIVNTYDPADGIVYVHMARDSDPYAVPVTNAGSGGRLPVGYANNSLRTRLSGQIRRTAASV